MKGRYSMNLVTFLGKQILGVLAAYQQGDIVLHICGVYPQWDNRLRLFFPKGHSLKLGDLATIHLDNRTGVDEFDSSIRVYRASYKGRVISVEDDWAILEPRECVLLHAVVVGRSPILGKPVAMMLLNANATVTICHSKTEGLAHLVSQADIVVGAVGKPEFIKGAWIKPGAVVVDAGYHPGAIGDIELSAAIDKCAAYTPVPGGVGPMTIATLMAQTVDAAEKYLAN